MHCQKNVFQVCHSKTLFQRSEIFFCCTASRMAELQNAEETCKVAMFLEICSLVLSKPYFLKDYRTITDKASILIGFSDLAEKERLFPRC